MTPDLNWSIIEIDIVKPICMFDNSKDEKLKEAFNWKKTHSHYSRKLILKRGLQIIS